LSTPPQCGDAPLDGVITAVLGVVSLTLVRSANGYCFSAWTRHDGVATPAVPADQRGRVFPSVDEAVEFYRELLSQLG
jgi:hypothetical protein